MTHVEAVSPPIWLTTILSGRYFATYSRGTGPVKQVRREVWISALDLIASMEPRPCACLA
jgi:hypothetical protein